MLYYGCNDSGLLCWKLKTLCGCSSFLKNSGLYRQGISSCQLSSQLIPCTNFRARWVHGRNYAHNLWRPVIATKMVSKLTQLKYREKLIESFITAKWSEMSTKQGGRPSCSNLLQLIPQQFPNVIPPNEIKANPSRICNFVQKIKLEKNLDVNDTGLYASLCFEYYHTKKGLLESFWINFSIFWYLLCKQFVFVPKCSLTFFYSFEFDLDSSNYPKEIVQKPQL